MHPKTLKSTGLLVTLIFATFASATEQKKTNALDIVGRLFKNACIRTANGTLAGFNGAVYSTEGTELGVKEGIIVKAILNIVRNIKENPDSKDNSDKYLVEDSYRVGLRFGAGWVLAGDFTDIYQFRLVYPIADKTKLEDRLVDLTLPLKVLKKKLPAHFVLMVEHFLEGTGRVISPDYFPVSVGGDAALARVKLSRRIIDNKSPGGSWVVHNDATNYWDKRVRALLGIAYKFHVPFAEAYDKTGGHLKGNTYSISANELENPVFEKAVSDTIWPGTFKEIAKLKEPVGLEATHKSKGFLVNLFGMFKSEKRHDSEDITFTDPNQEGSVNLLQQRLYSSTKWAWFRNGETQQAKIFALGSKSTDGSITPDTTLDLQFAIVDSDARTVELNKGYFDLANGLAQENHFVKFSPDPNVDRSWKAVNSFVNVQYCADSLNSILNLNEGKFWKALDRMVQGKNDRVIFF